MSVLFVTTNAFCIAVKNFIGQLLQLYFA